MTARFCPVIRRMPRRKPAPPQSRAPRLWPRLLTALLALIAMGSLWLIDTAALLMLTRSVALAHPWRAAAIIGVLVLLLALAIRRGRAEQRRKPAARPRRPKAIPPKN